MTTSKDHKLQPGTGFRQSSYLQELALYVGQQEVFDDASETLLRVGGISLSDKSIERLCHHYGEVLENELPEEKTAKDPQPHYAMIDGSMVLTREEKWKEIKLGRVFPFDAQLAESESRSYIKDSSYTAHFGDHNAFFEKFFLQVALLTQVVFICDGAKWIWNWIDAWFPNSVQILDWYHVIEKISQFGLLVFPDKAKASQWIDQQKEALWNGQISLCIEGIEALELRGQKAEEKRKLLGYLDRNRKRMQYKTFREQGYNIGSGPIEAANRKVIQKRLKLSGQRWSISGAQQVANIRTTFLGPNPEKITQMVRNAA